MRVSKVFKVLGFAWLTFCALVIITAIFDTDNGKIYIRKPESVLNKRTENNLNDKEILNEFRLSLVILDQAVSKMPLPDGCRNEPLWLRVRMTDLAGEKCLVVYLLDKETGLMRPIWKIPRRFLKQPGDIRKSASEAAEAVLYTIENDFTKKKKVIKTERSAKSASFFA
jgi:hypothetical protein